MERHNYKVMIVDDEGIIRKLIHEEIKTNVSEKTEIIEAENGLIASDLIDESFHVVITDLKMPKLDGLQLIPIIKEASPQTEIIVITGYATMENAIIALKNGAYDYLLKPFDNLEVISFAVRNALEKSILARENKVLLRRLQELNKNLEAKVKRRTSELRNTNQRLFDLYRNIEEFLSIFTHDVKTQVVALKGLMKIIADESRNNLNKESLECLELCEQHLLKLSDVVQDTISFSRVSLIENRYSSVSVDEFLDAAIGFCQKEMTQHKIKIIIDNKADSFSCDRDKMYLAFITILSSMIERADHSKRSYVKIDVQKRKNMVEFIIEDNGIGLKQEFSRALFRTYSGTSGRAETGGFAMAIVKKIIESHGGMISFSSQSEIGSKYVFTIPSTPLSMTTN